MSSYKDVFDILGKKPIITHREKIMVRIKPKYLEEHKVEHKVEPVVIYDESSKNDYDDLFKRFRKFRPITTKLSDTVNPFFTKLSDEVAHSIVQTVNPPAASSSTDVNPPPASSSSTDVNPPPASSVTSSLPSDKPISDRKTLKNNSPKSDKSKTKKKKIITKLIIVEDKEVEDKEVEDKEVEDKEEKPKPKESIKKSEDEDVIEESKTQQQTSLPSIKITHYYLDNRKKFITYINKLFDPYKKDIEIEQKSDENQCEQSDENDISPMTHQKIIKEYANLYTPYRGLLLYHGLGAGKTCSSIGIAEGMKTTKNVIIMTPASLQTNFMVELKKCGDNLYKKNQFWKFVSLTEENEIEKISKLLQIEKAEIRKKKGAWMVETEEDGSKKKSNYDELSMEDKNVLDQQIDKMIQNKYKFIAYNGIRWNNMNALTNQYRKNPFDNAVVIIDEAHNFVSRIVNKLKKDDEKQNNGDDIVDLMKKIKDSQAEYSKQLKIFKIVKDEVTKMEVELKILDQTKVTDERQREKEEKKRNATKDLKDKKVEFDKEKKEMLRLNGIKNKNKKSLGSISCRLYEYLMNAENAKIILLSGTPIINYPNEIAILFNILRGKIKTWKFNLADIKRNYTNADFDKMLTSSSSSSSNANERIYDYLDYDTKNKSLTITRNPFGFVNTIDVHGEYIGTHRSEMGNLTDNAFENSISSKLINMGIKISEKKTETYKALPDIKDDFNGYFISNDTTLKNENLFKRRIMGLTSYFRSATEALMPAYDKSKNFHIVEMDMSDHQFKIYNEARESERNEEKRKKINEGNKVDNLFSEDQTSSYRIFSRAFCNFVFPSGLKRPFPVDVGGDDVSITDAISKNKNMNEDNFDGLTPEEKLNMDGASYDKDDIEEEEQERLEEEMIDEQKVVKHQSYNQRIANVLKRLVGKDKKDGKSYLSEDKLRECSPKFLEILKNIRMYKDSLHLVYTQFRTLEGVGILKLVLEANGYTQFKTKINPQTKELVLDVELVKDEESGKYRMAKPTFVLYTGTETKPEKELIRNIFNGNWKYIPKSLADQLKLISNNNMYGDIINVFMITASGAEGISLKNVRYVHITEPYWHPVRMEQVIGRARRICSHQDLPKDLRTVDVFLYLMKLTKEQIKGMPIGSDDGETSDQALYSISTQKEAITESILRAVKESAIDCAIHKKEGDNLKCFSFGSKDNKYKDKLEYIPSKDQLAYVPSIEKEEKDEQFKQNVREEKIRIQTETIKHKDKDITFYVNVDTNDIYDPKSYDEYKRTRNVDLLKIIGKKIGDGRYKMGVNGAPATSSSSSASTITSSSRVIG